uniref:Mediator of DNA damage checkpoint protein 1 n=1 Tax=Anopheles christyi TaxID=43041 RepID=A0A182KD64_9DIPT
SICPKHASVRFDSNKVEILDLCSEHGVTVDQKPIEPLNWIEITTNSQLQFGSVLGSIVSEENKKDDDSFLQDDDSQDVIDCSLELIETKASVHEPASSPMIDGRKDRRSSFLVPETQQLNDSRLCEKDDKTPIPISGPPVNEMDDDDDSFFIPETQQPEDELSCPSDIIEPILPDAKEPHVERTAAEEEYFQMTADDNENSNDALFNNKYVEESQNLMQNLDESYKQAVEPRVSILPERSVDSISFQEHRNTTMEMSAMVWNESRQNNSTTSSNQVQASNGVALGIASKATDEADDRSVTPELNFDDDLLKTTEKRSSVTPEIHFKDGPDVAHHLPVVEEETNRSAVTPELGFNEQDNEDNNEHEISLNQEGCFKRPNDVPTEMPNRANVSQVENIYEMETQPFRANVSQVENIYEMETQPFRAEDAYELLTQPLHLLPAKSGAVGTKPKTNKNDRLEVEPYDLQTQPLNVQRKTSFVKCMSLKSRSKSKQSPEIDYADMPTQPETPPESAFNRKSSSGGKIGPEQIAAKLLTLKNKSISGDHSRVGNSKNAASNRFSLDIDYADLPTQPETPPEIVHHPTKPSGESIALTSIERMPSSTSAMQIDDDDLLTQPLSPPKEMMDTPAYRDVNERFKSSATCDVYNLDTEPLSPSLYLRKEDKQRKLFVKLEDIKNRQFSKPIENPYFMNTQPMAKVVAENVYDLETQVLPENAPLPDGEVSQFNPQINSTTVHQGGKQSIHQQALEISPSTSNKENHTAEADRTTDESSETDDEFGLSETIPIATLLRHNQCKTVQAVSDKPLRGKFKVPSIQTERAATPKAKLDRKRRCTEMTEFLTPEHPLLYLPKADCIRSVSDKIATSSSLATRKGKPAYHFNDSSSSSDDERNRNVFKKTNVSVALEKELEKLREDGKLIKQEERTGRKVQSKSNEEQSVTKESTARDESSNKQTVSLSVQQKEPKAKEKGEISAERKSSRRRETEKEKGTKSEVEINSKRSADTKEEKERHKKSHKSERGRSDRGSSSSAKEKDKELVERKSGRQREVEIISEVEKRSSRTADKNGEKDHYKHSHKLDEARKEHRSGSRAFTDCTKLSNDDPVRVSTRIRQQSYKMHVFEESMAYEAKSTAESSTRTTRKRKDRSSAERGENCKIEEAAPITRASLSKRPKSGQSSTSSSTVAPEGRRNRLRSTASDTKKVVQTSSHLIVGQSVTSSGGGSGLPWDISATSSTGSDGSAVSGRSVRPRLMFTRMSSEPYRKCIARAGCKIVDIPELATILVTDRIIRTYKFLCAVAKGIPIVGQSYLDALQRSEANEQINPWDHILSDVETEKRYKFQLRDTLLKAQKKKLFQDYTVFVTSSTKPPPSELFLILTCAGAKPSKHCSPSSMVGDKVFVISDPADVACWVKYRERFPGIQIVSAEGFMVSMMQQSINFQKHHLM